MFTYEVKIEGVRSCMLAWLANTNYVSLFQRGNSLAYELRLLPQYISKQCLHRYLARDREAGETTYMYVLLSIQLLAM